MWSDPTNLLGSPRNRAIESTRLGTVLPEGSNFNLAVPIINLGGRGIGASLALYYNSRVWSQHGNAVTFDPVTSWPTPGFSLGFGRIVPYDINYYAGTWKLLLVEPDGTRRYLAPTQPGVYQTTDGSHITYSGDLSGGSLRYNDGTYVGYGNVNNRLLPGLILERNGNYLSRAPDK